MSRMMSLLVLSLSAMVSTAAIAEDGDAALMKACPGVAAWAADHPRASAKADEGDEARHMSEPVLRSELARRSANDQRVRESMIAAGGSDAAVGKKVAAVDADNLFWLKGIVGKQGFPTIDQVGETGFKDAWQLLQHADSDPAFQMAVLEVLKPRLATDDVPRQEFAMLTDRVLRGQGKPQRYGSQFMRAHDGAFVLEPTEGMEQISQRREAMGLMPLAAYSCMLRFTYALPAKAH